MSSPPPPQIGSLINRKSEGTQPAVLEPANRNLDILSPKDAVVSPIKAHT
jgi:hypothetical protein